MSRCLQLVVADTNRDIRFGDEADGLLLQLGRSRSGRVLCCPLAAEVELVVGLARESYDVRRCRSQERISSKFAARLVVGLIRVGVGILLGVLAVVVIPQEGVANRLRATVSRRIVTGGNDLGSWLTGHGDALEFTQPVLMANLRVAALNGTAAAVEVRQLTLLLGSDELCGERQADGLPTLGQVDEAVRRTLIPHAVVVSKRVAQRTVEVFLVNEQMVAGSLEVALYQVSVNDGDWSG